MKQQKRMGNHSLSASQITILGLMIALLLLMAWTPLGYLNIGPLAISFNMIPVAISAIALGPLGGTIAGAVFGITSCLQCVGIGGASVMGVMLFNINPILALIQRFVPRVLTGLLLGHFFQWIRARKVRIQVAGPLTGFLAAFLNTLFFMTLLVLLFGNTEYVQNLVGGRNILIFIVTFVGINAVCEMAASTIITGAVANALYKARILPGNSSAAKEDTPSRKFYVRGKERKS